MYGNLDLKPRVGDVLVHTPSFPLDKNKSRSLELDILGI